MLKYLYPQINWQLVKAVGFDLDGTLYDELEFIQQVYNPIAQYLAKVCVDEKDNIYNWMVERWLEKGSSYNHIFEEVLTGFGSGINDSYRIINECIGIYRNFLPKLNLPKRVHWLLNYLKHNNYKLFIVTDGNSSLQFAKLHSLDLYQWIDLENIAVSGSYGKEYEKPSIAMTNKIELLQENILPGEVVYFGDREVDKLFAAEAGFQFMKVYCLVPKE